jgi:hypothetical protein
MNGLHDFVAGGYPLPWNVISMAGLSDFVNGGFPLPQNPVYLPSVNGSLPKAPPMPKALINLGRHDMIRGFSGLGDCGCGGSCGGCGMGTLTGDTLIPQAMLPAFLQGDAYIAGFPTVYLAGAVALVVGFMFAGSKRGRR